MEILLICSKTEQGGIIFNIRLNGNTPKSEGWGIYSP